jgi:hypothetical protein
MRIFALMQSSERCVARRWALLFCLLACFPFHLDAQTSQTVYDEALQNGWQNWSWGSVIDFSSSAVVHSGSKSTAITITNYWVTNTWGAIYLHHPAFDSSPYANLTFWINGGPSGGQQLQVAAELSGTPGPSVGLAPLAASSWQQISIPLSALGVDNKPNMDGFWIQEAVGTPLPTFYLDDVALMAVSNAPNTNTQITIAINVSSNRHAISPLVYGVAFATPSQLADLNAPLNRSGGNTETRYNWVLNTHNHASDWYFETFPDNPNAPAGTADQFVTDSKNGGAQPLLTIPMIGWLPSQRAQLASYSIAKYGPQTGHDPYAADAGNGVGTNTSAHTSWLITTNNPLDANIHTNSTFQRLFIQHLTNTWGVSTNGGVRYYLMDNEHALWNSTHRDVHPVGTTMTEIRDDMLDYMSVVKSVDPAALVLGPEEWGWPGYMYSGYDWQWAGAHNNYNPAAFPDRSTNGGWDYIPWLLDQLRQRATNGNPRLLDYLTVHIYPQGDGQGHYESGNDVSTATQLLRNRSTRQLWDTNYFDPSWIQNIIMLIPRLKGWVATYYPGTKTGVTEYNWGAEGYINGATAQADIFGIFGREGLELATRWTTPTNSSPTYKAMKMYRNYDGSKSTFGDTSVSATVPNPDNVSAFAALRSSDGALTAMVINKQLTNTTPVLLNFTNFLPANTAQVWQLTSANTITRLSDLAFTGNTLSNTVPPQSITLFMLPAGGAPHLRAGTVSGTTFDVWLDGVNGQRYMILGTTDFATWTTVQTTTLSSSSVLLNLPVTTQYEFFRAQWMP